MQKHILPLIILLITVVTLRVIFLQKEQEVNYYVEPIQYTDGEIILRAEKLSIAKVDTDAERTIGLSGQETIGENQGLLFVFPDVSKHGIWMRRMNFAIDIIWLDEDFRVVDFKESVLPESFRSVYDAETFLPNTPSKYVLEVAAGFVSKVGLQIGDIAEIHETKTAPQE